MQRNASSSSSPVLPLAIRLRYWPTALQLLFMRTIALLPLPAIRWLGAALGTLLWPLARERRQITLRNLELCFPALSAQERVALAKQNFRNTASGFLETAKVWFTDTATLGKHVEVEGLTHLQQAVANGKGVLVLGFHLTDLELGGAALAPFCKLAAMYRPHANPVFEHAMRAGRERHFPLIPRDDVRAMLRWLKSGGCVWYAADQDYGAQHSVFAPFFGIPTATITATSRFAKLSGAAVVPFTHVRTVRGIKLILHPPLTAIPSGDDAADAESANAFLEQWLRSHPADYLWLHRRFKTRPAGAESLYPKRKPRHGPDEISGKRLDQLLAQTSVVQTGPRKGEQLVCTAKGEYYWLRPRRFLARQTLSAWPAELAMLAPELNLTIARIQRCPTRHCELVRCVVAVTAQSTDTAHTTAAPTSPDA